MSRTFLRRAVLAATASAALGLLAACGSSSTESAFTPERIVSFGDAFADQGQNGGKYTVNDTAVNHWVDEIAVRYGRTITASNAGGLGYGMASARVTKKPDLAGNASTLTITEQVDRFLATQTINGNELAILSGGIADVVAEDLAVEAGTQTFDQAKANVQQAGRDMAAQARRLVNAGVKHVAVAGVLNVGYLPWAGTDKERSGRVDDISLSYNEAFLVAANDLGSNVLYLDTRYYFNLLSSRPGDFSFVNAAVGVCTSVDPGPGIGLGAGQVNSSLCNTTTVLANVDYNQYVYADMLYPGPRAHRLFGDYAYERIRNRW